MTRWTSINERIVTLLSPFGLARTARFLCATVFAILLVTGLWVGASTVYFPVTSLNVETGREIFHQRCASCHKLEQSSGPASAPSLAGIGTAAAGRKPSMTAEEYLLESITHPAAFRAGSDDGVMPADVSAGLNDEEVLSLVGFLMTLGSQPQGRRLLELLDEVDVPTTLPPQSVNVAMVESGRRLFLSKGQCATCHSVIKMPGNGLRAPPLLNTGHHSREYLLQSIRDPSKHLSPGYEISKVLLISGKVIAGRMMRRDEQAIEMLIDTNGTLDSAGILLADVERDDNGEPMITRSETSQMPDGLTRKLTSSEIEQIVEFLLTLK